MKITVIGGGPGGLYFALLTKKRSPRLGPSRSYEQNQRRRHVRLRRRVLRRHAGRVPLPRPRILPTSSATDFRLLGRRRHPLARAPKPAAPVTAFAGIARIAAAARACRTPLQRGRRRPPLQGSRSTPDALPRGRHHRRRRRHQLAHPRPLPRCLPALKSSLKSNRFCWMGSTRPMGEFNYFFRQTDARHHLRPQLFNTNRAAPPSIFEMDEACWQAATASAPVRRDRAVQGASSRQIFADELAGPSTAAEPLLLAPQFPRIYLRRPGPTETSSCSAMPRRPRTYSIGSGTKLAMECAIALSPTPCWPTLKHGRPGRVCKAYDERPAAPPARSSSTMQTSR